MKTVKITAEFTVTPKMFAEFKHFVEKSIFSNFGRAVIYDDVVGKTISLGRDGLKLTVEEIDS